MVRRRLLWTLGLGVPLGGCAAVAVAIGAFVGTTYLAISFGAPCHGRSGPPLLPGPCGGALARTLPYVMTGPAVASLTPYVVLLRRWVRNAPPPPRSPRASVALLRVLTGCAIGVLLCVSSLVGWSWLWMTLNDHVLHIGCLPPGDASRSATWACEGNLYHGVQPAALLLTIALGCAYPLLLLAADRPAEAQDVEVGL